MSRSGFGARWLDIARKDEHILRVARLVKGHGVIFDPIKIHAISDPKLSVVEAVSSHFVVSLFALAFWMPAPQGWSPEGHAPISQLVKTQNRSFEILLRPLARL